MFNVSASFYNLMPPFATAYQEIFNKLEGLGFSLTHLALTILKKIEITPFGSFKTKNLKTKQLSIKYSQTNTDSKVSKIVSPKTKLKDSVKEWPVNTREEFYQAIIEIISIINDYDENSTIMVRKEDEKFYLKIVDDQTTIDSENLKEFINQLFEWSRDYSTLHSLIKLSIIKSYPLPELKENILTHLICEIFDSPKELLKKLFLNHKMINDSLLNDELLENLLTDQNIRRSLISFLLRKQENEILDAVGFSTVGDNRQELVSRLENLDPKKQINQYVYKKLLIQAKLWAKMGEIEKMKSYPFKELYRFVIDGDCEKRGDYFFENEPGYIKASFEGLLYALNTINDKKDINWHEKMHDTIVDSVIVQQSGEKYVELKKGLAGKGSVPSFGVSALDQDSIGMDDVMHRGKGKPGSPFFYYNMTKSVCRSSIFLDDQGLEPVERKKVLQSLFDNMNEVIKNEENPIVRLMSYAWLARELELRHIYTDANGRTSIMVIYNLVAGDKDLPMLTFHDPNVLDVNGPEKLCARLLEAMVKFENGGHIEAKEKGSDSLSVCDIEVSEQLKKLKDSAMQYFSNPEHKQWSHFHNMMEKGKVLISNI